MRPKPHKPLNYSPAQGETATATLTTTSVITLTSTTTPTVAPTLIPAVVAEWDSKQVNSICLQIIQTFPQLDTQLELSIAKDLIEQFSRMGISATEGDDGCDAELKITLEGTVGTASYSKTGGGKQSCYTGARVEGEISLTSTEDLQVIERKYRGSDTPGIISSCPQSPTGRVNWKDAWQPAIYDFVIDIWGVPAAIAALKSNDPTVKNVGLINIKSEEAVGAVPILCEWLGDEYGGGSRQTQIVMALGRIGPTAKMAAPCIIEVYDDAVKNNKTELYVYRNVLEKITGLNETGDKYNPGYWLEWWDMVNNQDLNTILETLKTDEQADARAAAASSLGTVIIDGREDEVAVALGVALTDKSQKVRFAALESISQLGPRAGAAIPQLAKYQAGGSDFFQWEDTAVAVGLEIVPPLVQVSSTGSGIWSNEQQRKLNVLERVTQLPLDKTALQRGEEAWRYEVGRFLAACLDYYRANNDN
ncbi:MAG: hypothetical protein C0391_04480 [Anaerolinea sp.]|nr:hypothetical protein [Anaerolinea sp.]